MRLRRVGNTDSTSLTNYRDQAALHRLASSVSKEERKKTFVKEECGLLFKNCKYSW